MCSYTCVFLTFNLSIVPVVKRCRLYILKSDQRILRFILQSDKALHPIIPFRFNRVYGITVRKKFRPIKLPLRKIHMLWQSIEFIGFRLQNGTIRQAAKARCHFINLYTNYTISSHAVKVLYPFSK